jgi:hypothetical protein
MLGNGIVPVGPNATRPTKDVAAEFISKKLWYDFAGTELTAGAKTAMRSAALTSDLQITPWVRAMLLHDDFYTAPMADKYVRSPVEFVVALLVATGLRSATGTPLWLMEGMGQRPLFPPNVSGWKHNGYWVNASAMGQRTATAQSLGWRTMTGYWNGDGLVHLAGGTISKSQIVDGYYADKPVELLDHLLSLMRLTASPNTHAALANFSTQSSKWDRVDLVSLILMTPDLSVA